MPKSGSVVNVDRDVRLTILLRMRNISDNSCRKNQNTFLHSVTFFFVFENHAVYGIIQKKCGTAGRVTNYNMAHAHCTMGTESYKHTLRICNTLYRFYTGTVVALTPLNIKLCVNGLPCQVPDNLSFIVHQTDEKKKLLCRDLVTFCIFWFLKSPEVIYHCIHLNQPQFLL